MADMSAWLAAVIALLPPLAVAFWAGLRAGTADRLVALQLAAAVSVLILVLMSFAFDQPSFIDVPLTIAFLSLPGTLIFAQFLERWL
jgi:multisubunit Na+/H+ antiporter MnhF subunit